MRIFISTGEVAGDLQGGILVSALFSQAKKQGIDLEIIALGGDCMTKAGASLLANTTTISSIGLFESLPFVIPTWKIQQIAKKYLQNNSVDVIILIDYLGPNLAIGNFIKKRLTKVPIIWYIAPQYWIWSPFKKDVDTLLKIPDQILAIFPQEAKFYNEKGTPSIYVGHPLLERVKNAPSREEARAKLGINPQQKVISLFPASRKQEIQYLLPVMCQAAQEIKKQVENIHILIPISLSNYRDDIQRKIDEYDLSATLVEGDTLMAIAATDLAITKSGTVNLELGLLKIPQVVIYKVNPITIWIARNILNFSIPFMSPVNLVLMSEIVPELLQEKATVENIVKESLNLLLNDQSKEEMSLNYEKMYNILANGQDTVIEKTAIEVLNFTLNSKLK